MANGKNNKVKFGLNNVHYAVISGWTTDSVTGETKPVYETPKRIPGAVNLSLDANGEAENLYADNGVYYVINNNSGYEGDLEIALMPTIFATDVLGEKIDNNGLLVENKDAELAEFALLWEFDGDQHHIRHIAYRCSATRPNISGATTEESSTPQTDTIPIKMMALPEGLVKAKTLSSTADEIYSNWYNTVQMPTFTSTGD